MSKDICVENQYPRPILKWVGGKTQILNQIIKNVPKTMHNYHEPFLGGGSVLLAILFLQKIGSITITGNVYASDINSSLLAVYRNIQQKPQKLYDTLRVILDDYNTMDQEEYYYYLRKKYNSFTPKQQQCTLASAIFIFLNKTCFRGLHRVGPNGFNVPFGNYKNPEVINKAHLFEIHELLQPVIFPKQGLSYTKALARITNDNDFVYLDPPYVPETKLSFVGYTKDSFNHDDFFQFVKTIECKFLLSNSNTDIVLENFDDYQIKKVLCKRSINSKNPGAKVYELLITNF